MGCINLKVKTKKGKKFLYCSALKKEITFDNCKDCADKEYKKIKCKINHKKFAKKSVWSKKSPLISGHKHKLPKATEITMKVKKIVWERDNGYCIFCHKPVSWNCANSHYIKRSQLGMGIEENIFTTCPACHHEFDDTPKREYMLPIAKRHLMSKYENWNEDMLIYKKKLGFYP